MKTRNKKELYNTHNLPNILETLNLFRIRVAPGKHCEYLPQTKIQLKRFCIYYVTETSVTCSSCTTCTTE